jgi:hypothetical protein
LECISDLFVFSTKPDTLSDKWREFKSTSTRLFHEFRAKQQRKKEKEKEKERLKEIEKQQKCEQIETDEQVGEVDEHYWYDEETEYQLQMCESKTKLYISNIMYLHLTYLIYLFFIFI